MNGESRFKKVGSFFATNTKEVFKTAVFVGTWPTRKIQEGLDLIYVYDKDSGQNPPINTRTLSIFITCLILAFTATYYAFNYTSLDKGAAIMSGIFTLACLLWITESLPLFATSIMIIGLEILFLANPGEWSVFQFTHMDNPDFTTFLAPVADPIIVLFFGGFILAKAAVKRGVDASLASVVLGLFGTSPKRVMLGMMVITAFFSMWMSNTATATMMITLLVPIFKQLPEEKNFQKGLLLCVPFAANIGGMGTPIASPPNAVAVGFLNSINLHFSFPQWMMVAIPLVIVMLLIAFQIILNNYRPVNKNLSITIEKSSLDGKGIFVIFIFIITIGLWLSEGLHGLPTAVVALIPAIVFTATGLLSKKDINSLDWSILLLIAGGIALGKGMKITGLDIALATLLPGESPYIFAILVIATIIMSTLISNTATANLLIPVGVSLAIGLDGVMDSFLAKEIALGIALAASMAMSLPVSTAPNTIAYAQGDLRTEDFVKTGAAIGFIAVIIILTVAFVLRTVLSLNPNF